jgi:hypothetical protein
MASTSKQLNEQNVFDILNEPHKCLISDSSDDSDDCEFVIAVAVAAVDEEGGEVEDKGQGNFLDNTDYNTGTIIMDMNYFLVILDLKTLHKCSRYCVCTFIIFQ